MKGFSEFETVTELEQDILQVYTYILQQLARCAKVWNRQSLEYSAIPSVFILHTATSASVLNTKLLIMKSFEEKHSF